MLTLEEAQARLLALATPLPAQSKLLAECAGLYLAEQVVARRTQPPADLSAMDGYAIRYSEMPGPWRLVGESAAGRPYNADVPPGGAVRIFTGAHIPCDTDVVLVQEDANREGDMIFLDGEGPIRKGMHVRTAGSDFIEGSLLLESGAALHAGAIAVSAMAGYGHLLVGGIPKVSILATGDELLPPGKPCDTAHIPSSNNVMLSAMLTTLPCHVDDRGIIGDNLRDLENAFRDVAGSHIFVTSGGASVGDHDLIEPVLRRLGAEVSFWKVAIRPGKPVIVGRIGETIILGLPGNPSSAYVTAILFLLPLIRYLAGSKSPLPVYLSAPLQHDMPAGGTRTEFFRGIEENRTLSVFNRQDSGMLAPLSRANVLIVNPANAPSRSAGINADFIRI